MAKLPSANVQSREVIPFTEMEFKSKAEKQTPEYSRKILQSVYSYYVNESTELSWQVDSHIDELRLIGQGRQSSDFYKRYYEGREPDSVNVLSDVDTYLVNSADANRYGWMTYIEDNLSPIANIKTIIKDKINSTDYDVRAEIIDAYAIDEQDKKMMNAYVKAKFKDKLDVLRAGWGLPDSQERVISDDFSDLLELKRQGGFKQHYVSALEQLIKWTEQYSDWDDHLKERFFDDIFDLAYAFAYVSYDDLTGKPTWNWVDPKNVVVQQTRKQDFSDIDYGGFFDYPTINQLRGERALHNGKKEISTLEEWEDLAVSYAEYSGNPTKKDIYQKDDLETRNVTFSGKVNTCQVCRLNLWWKDYETTKEVEYVNPYGNKKRRKYKEGETVADTDRLVVNRVEKTYYARWIVGTEWMQDWGPMANMPRYNLKQAMFPFVGVKMLEKSFTERLIPVAHTFGLAWFRMCNAIAKAQNDGYAIDIQAILDLTDGNGKSIPWDDVIRMWREESIILYDSAKASPGGGTNIPITKIPGTLLEDFTKELALMDSMYAKVEQLIGVPPVALGVSPGGDEAVRNTQMSVSSSNVAVNALMKATMRVKKKLAFPTCSMWQNSLKYSERCRREASKVIGSDDIDGILKARNEFAEMGITMEPRPSQDLINTFVNLIQQEVARKNQGQAGIDAIDGMVLITHLQNGGNFWEAIYRAKHLKKKDEQRIQQEKQMSIQQQGQTLDQNARVAAEEERKTEQKKFEQLQAEKQADTQSQITVDNNNFLNEIKKMEMQMKLEGEKGV